MVQHQPSIGPTPCVWWGEAARILQLWNNDTGRMEKISVLLMNVTFCQYHWALICWQNVFGLEATWRNVDTIFLWVMAQRRKHWTNIKSALWAASDAYQRIIGKTSSACCAILWLSTLYTLIVSFKYQIHIIYHKNVCMSCLLLCRPPCHWRSNFTSIALTKRMAK